MKKKILIGILSLSIIGAISLVGVGYYFINYVAKPEQIRLMVIENIQKQFPNANVSLEHVSYSLFPGIKLNIKNLEMSLKKNKIPLVSLKDATVDIPILNVLKGGGRFLVKIDAPKIFFKQGKVKTNWDDAMGSPKKNVITNPTKQVQNVKKQQKDESANVSLPAFVLHSFLDIKVSNAEFTYSIFPETNGNFIVKKLLLKKVGLSGNSAFEMVSLVNLNAGENKISLKPILIGTFNLNEILFKKMIKIPMELKFHDTSILPLGWKFPILTNKINVVVHESGNIEGTYNFAMKDQNKINLNFSFMDGNLNLAKIKVQLHPEDFLGIMKLSIPKLTTQNSLFKMTGSVAINKNGRILPKLKTNISSPLIYKFEGNAIEISNQTSITATKITTKSKIKMFDGVALSKVSLRLPKDLTKIDLAKLKPITSTLLVKNITVPQQFITKMMANTKKTKAEPVAAAPNIEAAGNVTESSIPLVLPSFVLTTSMKNIVIGKMKVSHDCLVNFSYPKYSLKNCQFKIDKGLVTVQSSGTISKDLSIKNKTKAVVKRVSFESFSPFIPAEVGEIKGVADASVSLNAEFKGEDLKFNGSYTAKLKDGMVEKIDLEKLTKQYLSKLSFLKKKVKGKKLNLDNSFELIESKGKLSDSKITLSSFIFNGVNKKILIKGRGHIYPFAKKGRSEITGSWKDSAGIISNHLKKQTGKSELPFRLVGDNLAMLPDYEYSVKKIGNAYLKKQGKKKIEKVLKKKLGKNADKILKNKKVNKLLKGLFGN